MIDTHTHLYSVEFDNDIDKVVERAVEQGVERFLLPAIDSTTHEAMLSLEQRYPLRIYAMMGLHPCSVKYDNWEQEIALVQQYLSKRSFCAIGEIGIDLYWDTDTLEIQKKAFANQIEFALDHDLPIVIHSRESFREVVNVLNEYSSPKLRGVFHCFSGTLGQAQEAISLGFYLGIGGVVTFKNGKIDHFINELPIERLLLETDAPYLAPVPFRGKRNESAYVKLVAEKLATLYDTDLEKIVSITTANAKRLFDLK